MSKITQLVLSLTGDCNFACAYCYASNLQPVAMTWDTAKAAIDLVVAHNRGQPFILQLSGGEPLLNWPCIEKILAYVKNQGLSLRLQLQSNGSLLTKEQALALYRDRVALGFSLDGGPAVNDGLRRVKAGGSATKATVKALELLKELGIGCGLTCVVSKSNVEALPDFLAFAYYLGNVRRIGFDLLRSQGRGSLVEAASPQSVAVAMEQVKAYNLRLSRLFGYTIILSQQEKSSCQQHFGHCAAITGAGLFVAPEGAIYGCASFMGNQEYRLGHVKSGLEAGLQQQVATRITEQMAYCRGCSSFAACGGGCVARWQQGRLALEECALKQAFTVYRP